MKLSTLTVSRRNVFWSSSETDLSLQANEQFEGELLEQVFKLNDGRALGFQLLGDPNGKPLFLFHGTPGSRLCLSADDPIANIPGLRLILPERPGYGLSTEQPDRTIPDWANDVVQLADALGLDLFSVSGGSGGGPYALACGVKLPTRVNRILLFNTASPLDGKGATKGMAFGNRVGLWTASYAPWLLKRLINMSASAFRKNPDANMEAMKKQLPEEDAIWMKSTEFREAIKRDFEAAYASGSSGHFIDAILAQKDWGIDLGNITQIVHLWHGEKDNLSPIQNARRMAAQIPNCRTRYLPTAGHFLIDLPEIIDDVTFLLDKL